MKKQLNYIDLFAGAGGLSEGFVKAGFNPIAHVEMDEAACYTLKTRTAFHYLKSNNKFDIYTEYLKGEINRRELYNAVPEENLNSVINLALGDENNNKIFRKIDIQLENKEVDIIIGGPPCQAYSLVGRARSSDGMQSDPRNYLYLQYAKYLKKYQPKLFVFENVLGLRSAKGGEYFKKMVALFNKLGYEVADYLLNANNFGVLQSRKRIILIGYKKELNISLPDLNTIKTEKYLVQDIFNDLPYLRDGEGIDKYTSYGGESSPYLKNYNLRNGLQILTQHVSRPHTDQDKEIYKIAVEKWQEGKRLNYIDLPARLKTHNNVQSFFDRFKVVAGDLNFSHTVVAHIAKDGHYYIHPDLQQNRSISIREAARLQSFSDDFYFEGVNEGKSRTAAFKQIGNAVPPLMAYKVAIKIKEVI